MPRRSLPRRILGALASDVLALALRLPGGVLVGLVAAPVLAVGTVGAMLLLRRGVSDGR